MNIQRKFIKYVSGSVLGMIGMSCYILADTFFIAQGVGENGLTALNLAIPVFSLITGVGLMTGIGGATLYSLNRGKNVFTQSLYPAVIGALLFMLCGIFFSEPLSVLLGADEVSLRDTSAYIRIITLSAPFFILNNLVSAFVRNDNAPKTAMAAMLAGSFSNILLDYIFIFPLDWGMAGAAFATCLAPIIGLSVLSVHFIRKKNTFTLTHSAPDLKKCLRICTLGLSALITEFSSAAVIIVFNIVILGIAGNTGVAAYGIIANIALVVVSIFTGCAQGMQPLISESRRIGDKKALRTVLAMGLGLSLVISTAVYAVSFLFAEEITALFNSENSPVLAETAARGIRLYFTSYFACGLNIIVSASLSAADSPKGAFVLSILRGFALLIPTTLILASLFALDGVWLSVTVSECVCAVLSAVLLRKIVK